MTTSAKAAHGTLLKKASTTIAETFNIGGPNVEADAIDVTSHDSTSAYREKIRGLIDGGTVPFSINYLPANATHKAILTDLAAGTVATYNLVLSDGASSTWSFSAFPSSFSLRADAAGHLVADCALTVTGVITYPS